MTTTLWVSAAVVLALSLTFALRRFRLPKRKPGLLAVSDTTRLIEHSVGVGNDVPLKQFIKSRTKP
jgi:hypothetical protein